MVPLMRFTLTTLRWWRLFLKEKTAVVEKEIIKCPNANASFEIMQMSNRLKEPTAHWIPYLIQCSILCVRKTIQRMFPINFVNAKSTMKVFQNFRQIKHLTKKLIADMQHLV